MKVKVTITFRNTNTMTFTANDFVKTRDKIILGRQSNPTFKTDIIMVETTKGMIYFDPKGAIGFEFERI